MAEDQKVGKEAGKEAGKRKILIATDNFLPRWDGISRFLAEMIPRLKDRYDLTIIAPDFGYTAAEKAQSFRFLKMPTSRIKIGDFPLPRPNKKIIRQEVAKADLVFSQTIGPVGLAAINAAKKEKKKVISYIHSVEWELITQSLGIEFFKNQAYSISRSLVRNVYKKVDVLLMPAQSVSEVFSWHQIDAPKRIVHLGVDTKKFTPPARKDDAKALVGIAKDIFVIGFHGRIGREKDLLTLLRAYIQVKKHHPKSILLIVGDGVESVKKKLKSVRGVVVTGSKHNVVPYIQAMDVFCLTSLTETTSLSVLEAMACGVPVITNKVGFVKDYVKDGKNGLFFNAKNSYDLSKHIQRVMKDEDLRKRLSLTGRKFVEKYFDWDLTAKEIIKAIDDTIEGKEE
ncbi:glycosyltransferase family 4 protein [Candidatus Woesearchaeota archaeon]|nr:glycosyltransferase family 4 protein [Candidatus Woesearchaeota archaeon]